MQREKGAKARLRASPRNPLQKNFKTSGIRNWLKPHTSNANATKRTSEARQDRCSGSVLIRDDTKQGEN